MHSNSIFLRFKPRLGSIETVFKAAISREGKDQRVWLEKVAWCAFVMLFRECTKGCWFSCVPLPRGFTQRIFLDSVPKGGEMYFLLDIALLFLV